ncbi:piggyBac transposable element-derived protein 3-like [Aphis craccivora]|uniref:PiggyBac transposable element-derived protein 3-like n=1 Tax=Aphis craccivora TaxID=307492 RepID=A0A6G0WCN2_APHCR|nr:piggyBac transposable element-derived protein 3-like [Aphis craccivora]
MEGDIFIEPPNPSVDTDEDSGDEDGSGLVDNLSSRQFTANAEIRLGNKERVGNFCNELVQPIDISSTSISTHKSPSVETSVLTPELHRKWLEARKKSKQISRWEKGADFDIERPSSFPKPDYSRYKSMSAIDIFEKFIDTEIIEHLVVETRRYALFLNCPDPNITAEEIRCFIAILNVSGYNNLPSKRHYWVSKSDMKNVALGKYAHIDNFVPEQHLAYDESVVKYFGRHSCKQFIRGKPIRFGYKVWCLNTKDGYLVNFELYQGKSPKANTVYEQLFGKAASPLLVLIDEIREEKRQLTIGTIRENRTQKNCPLQNKKLFAKRERGYFETVMDKSDGLLYVRWMDNAVVTMISTSCGTKEISHVKRPNLIAKYNTYMRGTDQMDQNLGCYRIGVRGKNGRPKVSQLEFRREVDQDAYQNQFVRQTRISDTLRFDKTDHLVQHTEEKKKKMCRKKLQLNCTNNVFKMICWIMLEFYCKKECVFRSS